MGCDWDSIVSAFLSDDRDRAAELLAADDGLATLARRKLRGNQIDPAEVAQEAAALLLLRWDSIHAALALAAAKNRSASHVPLVRWRVNNVILEAIRGIARQQAIGAESYHATGPDGQSLSHDPEAPANGGRDAGWAESAVWELVPRMDKVRSRVFFKIGMALSGSDPARTAFTPEEAQWRPPAPQHPKGRLAWEVMAELAPLLRAAAPPAAFNEWLAQRFGVTSRKPADLIAQWTTLAHKEFERLVVATPDLFH